MHEAGLSIEELASFTQRITVLVVDDDYGITQLLEDLLVGAGYHVLRASDGRTALAIARQEHPDIVLTDRMMPAIDGLTLARRLRANPATQDIPVVLMSSTRPARETLAGILFLPKPFELDQVLTIVATYAGRPQPFEPAGTRP